MILSFRVSIDRFDSDESVTDPRERIRVMIQPSFRINRYCENF